MYLPGIPESEDFCVPDAARTALCDHIAVLCSHVLLGAKPPKPTLSRWTGVAAVCNWRLRLSLFHGLLGPVLQALSGGAGQDEAKDQKSSLDTDARIPD